MSKDLFDRMADGRTDLVFDAVAAGYAATSADEGGVSLLQWCSYHGDVSAIKFLLAHGASLQSLEPRERRPCTARRPSARKQPSRCCWTRARGLMRKT